MVCRCSDCAPRFSDIRGILFKQSFRAMYVGDFIGLHPFSLYQPHVTEFEYTVVPLLLPESETVIGLTYSGKKRFDPHDLGVLSRYVFDITVAKIYNDRILTCGSIKQLHALSDSERLHTFVLEGPMLSFFHDNNMMCYSNTTYIPLNDQESASIGLVLGRLSQSYDMDLNEFTYSINLSNRLRLPGSKNLIFKKRMLRYPICRIDTGGIRCRIAHVEISVPNSLDDLLPSEGASGLYVLLQFHSNTSKPILMNSLEIVDRGNPSLYKSFLANFSALLSYALNYIVNNKQSPYITMELYTKVSNMLIDHVNRIMPHTLRINTDTFLDGLHSLEKNNYVLMDRNKNGFYWLSYSHSQNKNIIELKNRGLYDLLSHISQKTTNTYLNSSRNMVVESLRKGCYIAI